ncbi:MAG: UxaA family hydrolase [Pirellulales bacterium]|nr:UxaA family hydrolase [Pirellulales bacterium]
MNRKALIIHPDDNVANLIGPGVKGDAVECAVEGRKETQSITLREDVPANHKFAAADIPAGATVVKYGLNIGRASRDIARGDYVHVHNVESNRGRGDLQGSP